MLKNPDKIVQRSTNDWSSLKPNIEDAETTSLFQVGTFNITAPRGLEEAQAVAVSRHFEK
jgi:hypothetical protein